MWTNQNAEPHASEDSLNEESESDVSRTSEGSSTSNDNEESESIELVQNKQPMKGDKILYFCKKKDSWQVITLTSNVFRRYLTNG